MNIGHDCRDSYMPELLEHRDRPLKEERSAEIQCNTVKSDASKLNILDWSNMHNDIDPGIERCLTSPLLKKADIHQLNSVFKLWRA